MNEYIESIWNEYTGLLADKMIEAGANKNHVKTGKLMAAAILYATAELLHDHIDELTKKNETGAGQEIPVIYHSFLEFGNRIFTEYISEGVKTVGVEVSKVIDTDPEAVFHAFDKDYSLILEASGKTTIEKSIFDLDNMKVNGLSVLRIMLDTLESSLKVLYTVPRFIHTLKYIQDEVSGERARKADKKISIDDKIAERAKLKDQLKSRVKGQDYAIDKFVDGYIRYLLRGKTKGKPAVTYLFAGPPGVGKTYLAKSFFDVIQEEGYAYKQFDMSAYREENSITGLVGFEKTWKGAQPGLLTGFVREHPKCVLLFDEIEKAVRSVIQLFLSVLEGAELTDRYYDEKVSFEQAILIFTTNEGKDLYEDNRDRNLTLMSDQQVIDGLEDTIFPPEMISRFAAGNIIMFNHLSINDLKDVFIKRIDSALSKIKDNMQDAENLSFSYDPEISAKLYLTSRGGNIDARNVASDAGKIAEDLVVNALEEAKRQGITLSELSELHLEIDMESMDEGVKTGLNPSKLGGLLYFGEEIKLSDDLQQLLEIKKAENEDVFSKLDSSTKAVDNAPLTFILIDLFHELPEDGYYAESEGYKCLENALKKRLSAPVLVVDSERFSEEERKQLIKKGVKDFVRGMDINENKIEPLIDKLKGLHFAEFIHQMVRECKCVSGRKHYEVKKSDRRVEIVYSGFQRVRNNRESLEDRRNDRKYLMVSRPEVRLDDVFGNNEAKDAIKRCIDNIRHPEKYRDAGGKLMKGILMYGAPGMGKTMFAKAMAYESGAEFIPKAGSDFLGENGIETLGKVFGVARRRKPCIIFIDEFDAISRRRIGSRNYDEMVLEKLLKEMDGVESNNDGVYVVAATNEYLENLDPAVTGRFSEKIYFPFSTWEERYDFIMDLLQRKNLHGCISENAVRTLSFMMYRNMNSFREIESFFEGAISEFIFRNEDITNITDDYLFERFHTITEGERTGQSDIDEEFATAYHEAGHCLMQWEFGRDNQYVTIVSRAKYGGYASAPPILYSGQDFLDQICISYAGRAAEVILYQTKYGNCSDCAGFMDGAVNVGASSDLAKATSYAYNYVCRFGFLEDNQIVTTSRWTAGIEGVYEDEEFLPEKLKEKIWEKVEEVLEEQWQRTLGLLQEHIDQLQALALSLYYKKELPGKEIRVILGKTEIHAEDSCFEQLPDYRMVPIPSGGKYGYPWGSPIFSTRKLEKIMDYKEKQQRSGESFIYVVKREDGEGLICGTDINMAITFAWNTESVVRRFTDMEAAEAYLAMQEYLVQKKDGIIEMIPIVDGMDYIDDFSKHPVPIFDLVHDREYLRFAEENGIRRVVGLVTAINNKMIEEMEKGKDILMLVRVADDEIKKEIAEYMDSIKKRGRLL